MSTSILNRLIKIPCISNKPTGAVIFLHGACDTGAGIRQWVTGLLGADFQFPHLDVYFPTADKMLYTNYGTVESIWFDRVHMGLDSPEHGSSVETTALEIKQLINHVGQDLKSVENRIVIGGFSMGGGMALHMAYKHSPNLAGCFALSTFLNNESAVYQALRSRAVGSNKIAPLFQCHGTEDDVIFQSWAETTKENLSNLGVAINYYLYSGLGHEPCRDELLKLKTWITELLPDNCAGDV